LEVGNYTREKIVTEIDIHVEPCSRYVKLRVQLQVGNTLRRKVAMWRIIAE
jgi:hypothetical protein